MRKTTFIIMLITILSKIFGLGREITLSYFYGATNISDAYLISMTIPSVIFGIIAAGLAAGYIPMYNSIEQTDGEIEANKFTNNLINIVLVICSIIVLIGVSYTNQIVKIFASGFGVETIALTARFTKISLLSIYFTAIVAIFTGYLQMKENYIIPALVTLPLNFFVVISIILSNKNNILVLAIGYVVATAAQVVLMVPYLRKSKYRYKRIFDIKDKNIIKMAHIVTPVILGICVNQINVLVDRTIASRVTIGGVSALNYANRLNGFVIGIFVLSIVTVLYPMISKMAAQNNIKDLKKHLSEAITGINLLVLPATIGSMIFAVPIVSVLFGRGAFNPSAVSMTSSALLFYSIGMVGFGLREVLSRAFFSLQDTKIPMINAAIGMVLNIILNIILSRYLGIGGLALATSISALFTTILLFISLRKKIGSFGIKQISISFLKILFASSIMGLLSKITYNFITKSFSQSISLLIAMVIGAVSYFVIIYFMKIEGIDVIVGKIKMKLRKTVT
ncbi:murein biosynthesis integral membrane protein MurJ [Clostridium sp.]|uniref:murein biosynthesis integral membrane protein MurJ n=1 Tax=Clostridium sp. TaxID=1506 RepID=UPI001A44BB8F|nr:murein biosynthesis integral membrane protein MurJ [Clostridium sp.]MBK5240787.1 murein biosynthesis integral membrane protein MurJ [Clostridium sp.]